mmetsp:Transcript_24349/g.78228  ORF Transcript_24349/g.78228 Transcript_24349/m.78228 type:complete len:252 (+) Transcript_24349:213-968(+)
MWYLRLRRDSGARATARTTRAPRTRASAAAGPTKAPAARPRRRVTLPRCPAPSSRRHPCARTWTTRWCRTVAAMTCAARGASTAGPATAPASRARRWASTSRTATAAPGGAPSSRAARGTFRTWWSWRRPSGTSRRTSRSAWWTGSRRWPRCRTMHSPTWVLARCPTCRAPGSGRGRRRWLPRCRRSRWTPPASWAARRRRPSGPALSPPCLSARRQTRGWQSWSRTSCARSRRSQTTWRSTWASTLGWAR